MTATIDTIGYAGWAPTALRDHVLALDATLVDVRIAPTSKSLQWRQGKQKAKSRKLKCSL